MTLVIDTAAYATSSTYKSTKGFLFSGARSDNPCRTTYPSPTHRARTLRRTSAARLPLRLPWRRPPISRVRLRVALRRSMSRRRLLPQRVPPPPHPVGDLPAAPTSQASLPLHPSESAALFTPADSDLVASGANSFYIHTLQTNTRLELLDALKSAGMKVVRIFITDIYANNKGSGGFAVKDCK